MNALGQGRRLAAAIAVLSALAAGCGGDDTTGASRPAATAGSAPAGSIGEPLVVARGHVDAVEDAGGAGSDDVLQGRPSQEALRDLPAVDAEGLSAGTASCGDVDVIPTPATEAQSEQTILCLINAERTARDLRPLTTNDRLAKAAVNHTDDMVARSYFAHESPGGADPVARIRAAGYVPAKGRWIVGENLAWGAETRASPQALLDAWMASTGHRANILRPEYREIGLGLAYEAPRRDVTGAAVTAATTFGAVGAPVASKSAKRCGKARSGSSRAARAARARVRACRARRR